MSTFLIKDVPCSNVGLGMYAHSTAAASLYDVNVQMIVIPGNSVSIQILKNSTVLATSAAPSATQSHIELSANNINAALGDALNINITSPLASDSLPQAVKGTLQIKKTVAP